MPGSGSGTPVSGGTLTMGDVIAFIRRQLSADQAGEFYTDLALMGYVNRAQDRLFSLNKEYRLKSDGLFATVTKPMTLAGALTETLDESHIEILADYALGLAFREDNGDIGNAQRSQLHFERFHDRLGMSRG